MADKTVQQIVLARENDYDLLEDTYRLATGSELVRDPFRSLWHGPSTITLSVSIVIPAWNAASTIERCLLSIERSSFNLRYPHLLEVIVVDDGSTDSTWEILESSKVRLRLVAVQQEHHSRAHAMNTGLSVAQGDIIISCDADMILTFFSVEELAKRHQILRRVLLIGFRHDVDAESLLISPHALSEKLPDLIPQFWGDNRVLYHWEGWLYPGWPENMCRESDHLKKLGAGRQLWMPDGNMWNLQRMVYGALFSMHREDWQALQGFNEGFYGWGWEDTLLGARAIALGNYVVPVYAATGLHVAHHIRSPRQWKEAATNSVVYQRILRLPFDTGSTGVLNQARQRIVKKHCLSGETSRGDFPTGSYEAVRSEIADSGRLGTYLHHLGRYGEAVTAFSQVNGDASGKGWALFNMGKSLRAARQSAEAINALSEAASQLSAEALPLVELALAEAAVGDFRKARFSLEQARERDPKNRLLAYILHCPAYKHLRRGQKYALQGYHTLALRDYEAALIQQPHNMAAHRARERSLFEVMKESAER